MCSRSLDQKLPISVPNLVLHILLGHYLNQVMFLSALKRIMTLNHLVMCIINWLLIFSSCFIIAGCGDEGWDDFQPNQLGHMDGGCLTEESELYLLYGEEASDNITDYVLIQFYNELRTSVELPLVESVDGFSPSQYCRLAARCVHSDIPGEYLVQMSKLVGELHWFF